MFKMFLNVLCVKVVRNFITIGSYTCNALNEFFKEPFYSIKILLKRLLSTHSKWRTLRNFKHHNALIQIWLHVGKKNKIKCQKTLSNLVSFSDIYNDWAMMNNWFNNFKNANLLTLVIIFMKVKVDYQWSYKNGGCYETWNKINKRHSSIPLWLKN